MSILGEAFIALRAQDGGVAADAERIVGPSLAGVAKSAATILGGAVIGHAFLGQVEQGIDRLKEMQATTAQTEAAITSSGGAAGVSAQHVEELAKAGSRLSGVDDEVIAKGENVLLTFQQVANQGDGAAAIFDRATEAAQNLAARGFGDVASDSKLLGIALSDPEAGMTRLRRAGIILTEQQKDSIKQFASQNNLLGEQEVLLDAVNGKVGGAAKAYGQTLGGQVAIAQTSIKNMRSEMVAGAAPALELFAHLATGATDAVMKLPGPLRDVVAVAATVAVGFASIARPVGAALDLIGRFRGASEESTVASEGAAVAEGERAAATEAALAADGEAALAAAGLAGANQMVAVSAEEAAAGELAMEAAGLPLIATLGLVAAGAGILLGIGSALKDAFTDNVRAEDDYTKALQRNTGESNDNVDAVTAQNLVHSKLYDTLKNAGVGAGVMFAAVRSGTQDWGEYGRQVDRARTSGESHDAQIRTLTTSLHNASGGNDAFTNSLIDGLNSGKLTIDQVGKIVSEMEGLHNGYTGATDAAKKNKDAEAEVAAAHAAAGQQFVLEQDAIDQLTKAHEGFADFIGQMSGAMDKSYASSVAAGKANLSWQNQLASLTDAIKQDGATLDDHTEKGRKNLTQAYATGDQIAKLIEARFQETHSIDAATTSGNLYVESLKEQLRQTGMNEDEVNNYIATMHLTPDDIKTTFSNNALEQQLVVGKYLAQLDKVPPQLRSEIETHLKEGDYDAVNTALDNLAQGRTVVFSAAYEKDFYATDDQGHTVIRRAAGGEVKAGVAYQWQEGGPTRREMFVPSVDGQVLSADQLNQAMLNRGAVATQAAPAAVPTGDVVHVEVDARGNPYGYEIGASIGAGMRDTKWRFGS